MPRKLPPQLIEYFRAQGAIGGQVRAAKMTKKQRSESARLAAIARWAKPPRMSAAAIDYFREQGAKGGAARAAKMTKKQRSASAKKAALARWEGKAT